MHNNYTLLTGASGGIGYELAVIMAKKGHQLILVARSESKLSGLATLLNEKYKVKAVYFAADLTRESERLKLIEFVTLHKYHIEILINNAGFGDAGYFHEAAWEKNERMIQLNIVALTHLVREFLPAMIRAHKGKILNIASIAGFFPGPLMSVYYASKAFVISFSEALYSELKGTGVTVTALCPGPVSTNFFVEAGADDAPVNKIMKPAKAPKVALYGYNNMMKGKRLAIPGWSNKFIVWSMNFIPVVISNPILKRLHQ